MQPNLTQGPLAGRRKSTRPGEAHSHLSADINMVEFLGGRLIVEAGGHRRDCPPDATFPQVQRLFWNDFNVWLRDACRPGETHHDWWDRLTADAALRGAA